MKYKIFRCVTLLFAGTFGASSCIEEGTNTVDGIGKSRFRVPLEDNYSLTALDAANPVGGIFTVYRDAISNADLNTPVTMNYAIDPAILDTYNTEHEESLELLDPSIYTLVGAASGTISFAAGEAQKEIAIDLDVATIDFAKRYAIPFIFSSTGIEVSNTSNFAIIEVGVKNKYDGIYTYTGHIGRYDGGCNLIELGGDVNPGVSAPLSTTGANTVSIQLLWATGSGIGGIGTSQTVSIDPATNAVTVTPVGANPGNWGPIPGEPNSYDPETGEIYISYKWSTPCAGALYGHIRHVRVRLIYKGPR
jgi:hypothetical protein